MRRLRVAEWILSLVTEPQRASALAGDLAEENAASHAARFWLSLARTGVTLAGSSITRDFGRLLGSCALAFFLYFLVAGSVTVLLFLCALPFHAATSMAVPVSVAGSVVGPLVTGYWLARRSPGQEIAVCAVFIGLGYALGVIAGFVLLSGHLGTREVFEVNPSTLLYDLLLFVGAIKLRRRRLATV